MKVKLFRQFSSFCMGLSSGLRIFWFLSWKVNGLGLSTGSNIITIVISEKLTFGHPCPTPLPHQNRVKHGSPYPVIQT